MTSLRDALLRARERREPLVGSSETRAYRLVQGDAEGVPGTTLDRFDDVGVWSLYQSLSPAEEAELGDALMEVFPLRSLYLKRRPREARTAVPSELASEKPFRGEARPELSVKEHGLSFEIRPGQGLAVGLYLDMRETRRWLCAHAQGCTVLNAFAYTCAFGVSATAGGAARVLNIDLSRKALDWGVENARANGQSVERRDYLAGDVFDWLERLDKKGERFDVVILDPPSFAQGREGRRRVFSAATDYPELAARGARVTSPGGLLLACCNLAKLTPGRFQAQVEAGVVSAGRRISTAEHLPGGGLDFPFQPGEPPSLKVLACRLW